MNEYTTEQRAEAERLFNLRRRIYDSSNIKDNYNHSTYEFSFLYDEDVDFSGLSDQDKFALVVIRFDISDYGVKSSVFCDVFGWSKYKVYKLAKNEKFIYSSTLFSEDDGLIAGKGYLIEAGVSRLTKEMYNEFLWNEPPIDYSKGKNFIFDVEVPDIYKGRLNGYMSGEDGMINVCRPMYTLIKDLPNWPLEGHFLKSVLTISESCVKRWKIIY